MERVIDAWSHQQVTARWQHTCRLCNGIIPPKTSYITSVMADGPMGKKEKRWRVAEHLDCRFPWYLPIDISPTETLSKLRIPRAKTLPMVTLHEIYAATGSAGNVHWHAPEIINRALSFASPTKTQAALFEYERAFGLLARAFTEFAGNPEKLRWLGIWLAELQQKLGDEPDLSRLEEKKEED